MNGLQRLQSYLVQKDCHAMLITSPTNLHYFAGFTGTTAVAFVTPNQAFLFTDSRYTEQANKQCQGYEVIQYTNSIWSSICDVIRTNDIPISLCGIEGNQLPVNTYETICESFDDKVTFTPIDLTVLRQVKTEKELIYMRKAATIADEAFTVLLQSLQVGMTENEARIILETEMLQRGSQEPSFATIVASGYRSSMPHGVASDKVIEIGDFVTFDFGAVYEGYHSDMTRTIVMGQASSLQKQLYDVVLRAQTKGVESVHVGQTGAELDAVCRESIKADGYGEYFGHGTGHGVGLDIHELPVASPRSESVFEAGMIVTIEPGIYLPGTIGLRIEDSVIVTSQGCEVLTHSPKNLIELGI